MSLDAYLSEPPCPTCGQSRDWWSGNVTHNLCQMAAEAGIYDAVWRPEELGIATARQMVCHLSAGIRKLTSSPAKYDRFNPGNGRGSRVGFLGFLRSYLAACREHPDAVVRVSR